MLKNQLITHAGTVLVTVTRWQDVNGNTRYRVAMPLRRARSYFRAANAITDERQAAAQYIAELSAPDIVAQLRADEYPSTIKTMRVFIAQFSKKETAR